MNRLAQSATPTESPLKVQVLTGSLISVLLYAQPIAAQVVPDATLPAGERSLVTGNPAVQIDGGARRGGNLFHSFSRFSVPTGGSAHFNNAADVQNIFSRVTGGSISNIDGVIRANGTANLFLLNPNGILFGPNARLNIGGSFFASTGDRFQFADGSEFSAVNPQAPPLLTINITPGLQDGRSASNATIINRGNLAASQDLTLSANRLELQGSLQAGRDLSLQAQDVVQVRDSTATPFVAQAGRNLTIQGNQGIDILALNHPAQPAFVSGGSLGLISDGVISGDAHFASGNGFSIASLSGGLARFVSLYDPIISAVGNVDVAANYTGASLLVESQSNIRVQGNITITGPDTSALPLGPDTATLQTSSALVMRSNQSTLAYGGINSGTTPTTSNTSALPIGITLGGNVVLQPFNGAGGVVSLTTGAGDISTRSITTNGGAIRVTSAGSVTTNQQSLGTTNGGNDGGTLTVNAKGDIATGTITTFSSLSSSIQGNSGNGGDVSLSTTRGTISIGFTSTGSGSSFNTVNTGRGGDVTLSTADGSINTDFVFTLTSARSGNAGRGGNITLTAVNGGIDAARLYANSSSDSGTAGNGGRISVSTTNGDIKVGRVQTGSTSISGNASSGGDIVLSVTNGNIATFAMNSTATASPIPSTSPGIAGNGGAISLTAVNGSISTSRIESYVSALGEAGNGGAITLSVSNGSISTREWIYSGSFSSLTRGGRGGDITLIADGTIQPYDPRVPFFVVSTINSTGAAGSGNITIATQSPFLLPNTFLVSSDTFGAGRGGDIQITAPSIVLTQGSQISASTHSSGQGGDIRLRADSIQLNGSTTINPVGAQLRAGFAGLPRGTYVGGYIPTGANLSNTGASPIPAGTVFPTGAFTQTTVGATGNAGNLSIETGRLIIQDGAALATTTFGQNSNAGTISIRASEFVSLENGSILSGVAGGAIGNSGGIDIATPSLSITGGVIQTQTLGQGRAGDVQITAANDVNLSGLDSGVRSGSGGGNSLLGTTGNTIGQGGNIRVTTGSLNVTNGAALNAQTQTASRGGDITVDAGTLNLATNGQLLTSTTGSGDAGDIGVTARSLSVTSGAQLSAFTTADGNAGNITTSANVIDVNSGGQLLTTTSGNGRAGDIIVKTPDLQLAGATSGLFANTTSTGNAGRLIIQPQGNGQSVRVNLQDGAQISASTSSSGRGGDLTIAAPESITLTGDGSIIAAGTGGSGAGGNLNLRTGTLNIQNRAEVTVSSSGTGSAGSLFMDADRVLLNNQGSIRADTTGGGGNINVRSPFILLRNGSNITTNARGVDIPGGNIAIDTRFLIAVLSEDSNISANSQDFRGGNIRVNAFSIFGIRPSPVSTPLSDITATGASSALSGTINVITAGIDPTAGLVQLPTDPVEPGLIAQGCPADRGNSFIITGRGGLPPTPEQQLDDDAEWSDRRRLVASESGGHGDAGTRINGDVQTSKLPHTPHPTPYTPIIEANAIQVTPTGEIVLVANPVNPAVQNPLNQSVTCQRK
jgi:filamentous hemagglutinin family protein